MVSLTLLLKFITLVAHLHLGECVQLFHRNVPQLAAENVPLYTLKVDQNHLSCQISKATKPRWTLELSLLIKAILLCDSKDQGQLKHSKIIVTVIKPSKNNQRTWWFAKIWRFQSSLKTSIAIEDCQMFGAKCFMTVQKNVNLHLQICSCTKNHNFHKKESKYM